MIWYLDLMWNARPWDTDARDLKIAEQASTIAALIRLNRQLTEVNSQLHERIERLEALLASQVDSKSSKTPVFTENDSLGRNRHSPQDSDSRQKKDPPVASHAVRKHTSSGTPSKSSRTESLAKSVFTIVISSRGESSTGKPPLCVTIFAICRVRPLCRCRPDFAAVAVSSGSK
jgi:hypothetical protein